MSKSWDKRLYDAYVSSGQASVTKDTVAAHLSWRKPYIDKVIQEHIPADRDGRILDLGCGYGAFLYFLAQEGYRNLDGVDASAEQVALAHDLGLAMVKNGDIYTYLNSLENGAVDVVLLMDVMEHFRRQALFDMLDEVFRVLRPGGNCIAHVPNGAGLYAMGVRYGDLTHELAFTPSSIKSLFSVIGFSDIRCYEDKPVVHGPASALRRLIWSVGTLPARVLMAAETGNRSAILSRNMTISALKPPVMGY